MRPGLPHAHHPSLISLGSHTPASWSEFISKPGTLHGDLNAEVLWCGLRAGWKDLRGKGLCTQNSGVPEIQGPRGSHRHPELAEYGRTASSEN